VYTASGIIIRRRVNVTLLKMFFWQSGGFINVIAGIITANMCFLDAYYISISFTGFWNIALPLITFYKIWSIIFLSALEVSLLLQAIIGLVIKKVRSSESAAKEAEQISKCSKTASTGIMWEISGPFFSLSFCSSIFAFANDLYYRKTLLLVIILVSTAVYTLSGILIRKYGEVSLPKLTFCQAGGFITVIIGLIFLNLNWFDIFDIYISIFSLIMISSFDYLSYCFLVCLPALGLSFIIQAVIGIVMKKVRSSEAVTEENIAETNK
ncbi:MAG: hypothetical protein K2N60_07250, partial [Oscillospiraceae bacterium]|nr:hypothetical protein [Oscillospiraceae bacterium]